MLLGYDVLATSSDVLFSAGVQKHLAVSILWLHHLHKRPPHHWADKGTAGELLWLIHALAWKWGHIISTHSPLASLCLVTPPNSKEAASVKKEMGYLLSITGGQPETYTSHKIGTCMTKN